MFFDNLLYALRRDLSALWRGCIVRPNARAWRAREPQGSVGSNPTLSAIKHRCCKQRCIFIRILYRALGERLTVGRWPIILRNSAQVGPARRRSFKPRQVREEAAARRVLRVMLGFRLSAIVQGQSYNSTILEFMYCPAHQSTCFT